MSQSRKRIVRLVLIVAPLAILLTFIEPLSRTAGAVAAKLTGKATECAWPRVLGVVADEVRLGRGMGRLDAQLREIRRDGDYVLVETPGRNFWLKAEGEGLDARALLVFLIGDHERLAELNPSEHVQSGDVVIDCGAHVGVFTDLALQRGASKVVAVEPDPGNIECLRRNFREEIAAGRVVVYPKGAWSSETELSLHLGVHNSGTNSLVMDHGSTHIQIPVSTLDRMAEELNLTRVDFIKMDIEGAEREALRGSSALLLREAPRLMLDTYHMPDDMEVLPAIIREARPDYQAVCGPCIRPENRDSWIPHVSYYVAGQP
jgi:FkbM family methyltransferase